MDNIPWVSVEWLGAEQMKSTPWVSVETVGVDIHGQPVDIYLLPIYPLYHEVSTPIYCKATPHLQYIYYLPPIYRGVDSRYVH